MAAQPRLLDLFAGAGGCSVGYHRAGFEVCGVDIHPHRDYPYALLVCNALSFLSMPGALDGYDAVHASPPCPRYSSITRATDRDKHPDLVEPVRAALQAWGGPYVIENVPGSPLFNPVTLCGSMFDLGVRRHRLFETNVPMLAPECQHERQGLAWGVYGHLDGRKIATRPDGSYRGRKARSTTHAQQVMGIDWMTRWDDLTDAIPPAYTEWLGTQLLDHLTH